MVIDDTIKQFADNYNYYSKNYTEKKKTDYEVKQFLRNVFLTWQEQKEYYKIYIRLKQ